MIIECLSSNLSPVGIGRTINAMIDDRLGDFELLFFYKLIIIIICSIHLAKDIRTWLAAPDSSPNKNQAREKRQVDTCAWFLGGERFRVWQENPGFLWVKGKGYLLLSSILNLHV
jgi:hypothetical protein